MIEFTSLKLVRNWISFIRETSLSRRHPIPIMFDCEELMMHIFLISLKDLNQFLKNKKSMKFISIKDIVENKRK